MSKLASKIYVSSSKIPNSGKGVFATENIKKGDVKTSISELIEVFKRAKK